MPIEITMPRLSDTMEQGTVVKWYVKEGDSVSSGDVIADIETDKATMELESFDDGVVAKLVTAEGENVPIGAAIVILAEDGESADAAISGAGASDTTATASESGSTTATAAPPATTTPTPSSNGSATDAARVFASPLARKIASEQGVDLGTISGTGPSGRIVKADVEAASGGALRTTAPAGEAPTQLVAGAVAAPPAPSMISGGALEDKLVPLTNMRGTIAKRLVESKTTIPHYQVTVSARMDALESLRAQLNEQLVPQGVKLSVNDFLVRACATAMHEHPFINSSWVDQGPAIQLHERVNIGVAVALPMERGGGLVVATIRDADRIGLRQISTETKTLAKKARDKGLSVQEMADSTFTISNLGMFGVDHFTAIVNPPNACILAVGRAIQKPFIEEGEDGQAEIVIGSEMSMTMSSDHRIVDGAMAAQYLSTVKTLLENPATLLV